METQLKKKEEKKPVEKKTVKESKVTHPKKGMMERFREYFVSKKYPVKVLVLQQRAGKGFTCYDDWMGRKKLDNVETMVSPNNANTPPTDFGMYLPDRKGTTRIISLETSAGERHNLYPLTYGDIFSYSGDALLLDENKKPILNEGIVREATRRGRDTIIGLKAISKSRLDWLNVMHQQDLLKHPEKEEGKTMDKIVKGVIIIVVVLAIILFFQGGVPAILDAKEAIATAEGAP